MDIKKTPAKNKTKKKMSTPLKYSIIVGGIILIAGIFLFMQFIFEGMPSLEELESPSAQLASNVWSRDGELI